MSVARWRWNGAGSVGGFTLMETVVSLSIIALVLASLSSATVFMSRVLPQDGGPADAGVSASAVLDLWREDVSMASRVTELTGSSMTLVVPDRDGDGTADEVGYAWGGAGSALTRSLGSEVTAAVEGVSSLGFSWGLTGASAAVLSGAAESRLVEYGEDLRIPTGNALDGRAVAQPIRPALGGATETWSVDRVRLGLLRQGSNADGDAVMRLGVFAADSSGEPVGPLRASAVYDPRAVGGSMVQVSVSFEDPAVFGADEDGVVVVQSENDEVEVVWAIDLDGEPNTLLAANNGSGSWSNTGLSVWLSAYGRVSDEAVLPTRLEWASVRLAGEGVGVVRASARAASPAGVE